MFKSGNLQIRKFAAAERGLQRFHGHISILQLKPGFSLRILNFDWLFVLACDKECALWSTSVVLSFWISLASPCLTFYSFLEDSLMPELSFLFDFRSVLVALISPWQVNGQTSGGGFWVALPLWFWVIFQLSTFDWLLVPLRRRLASYIHGRLVSYILSRLPEVSVSRGLLLVVSLTVYPSVIGEYTILDSYIAERFIIVVFVFSSSSWPSFSVDSGKLGREMWP